MPQPSDDLASPLRRLAPLLDALQRRWGARALQRGVDLERRPSLLPSGCAALDTLLGGGLPRGALSEYLGTPTSGMTTLALQTLASAQRSGALGVFADLGETFDAAYAARCGVDLAALLVVRPTTMSELVDLLPALAGMREVGVLLVDQLARLQGTAAGDALLGTLLHRLRHTLADAACAVVALTALPYPPAVVAQIGFRGSTIAQHAQLRLHVGVGAWDAAVGETPQRQAQVTILKQHGAPDGRATNLAIAFPDPGGAW
jgi:recA bacterial DNA recombination protein